MRMTLSRGGLTAYFQLMAFGQSGFPSCVVRSNPQRGGAAGWGGFEAVLPQGTFTSRLKWNTASAATLIPDLESRIEIMGKQLLHCLWGKSPDWGGVARSEMNIEAEFPDSLACRSAFGPVARRPTYWASEQQLRSAMASANGLCGPLSPPDFQFGRWMGEATNFRGFSTLRSRTRGRCDRRPGLRLRMQAGQIPCSAGGIRGRRLGCEEEGDGGFRGSQRCGSAYRNVRKTAALKVALRDAARKYVGLA